MTTEKGTYWLSEGEYSPLQIQIDKEREKLNKKLVDEIRRKERKKINKMKGSEGGGRIKWGTNRKQYIKEFEEGSFTITLPSYITYRQHWLSIEDVYRKAKGVRGVRRKVTDEQVREAYELRKAGAKHKELAEKYWVSVPFFVNKFNLLKIQLWV